MYETLTALFAILFTIYAVKWHTRPQLTLGVELEKPKYTIKPVQFNDLVKVVKVSTTDSEMGITLGMTGVVRDCLQFGCTIQVGTDYFGVLYSQIEKCPLVTEFSVETWNTAPGVNVRIHSVRYMRGSPLVKKDMIGKVIRPVYKGLVTVEVNVGGTFAYGSFPPDDLKFVGSHL